MEEETNALPTADEEIDAAFETMGDGEDAAYVEFGFAEPGDAVKSWFYTTTKPGGKAGTDYETVTDAEAAFEMVRKRNEQIFGRERGRS